LIDSERSEHIMALSAFENKSSPPNEDELADVLGDASDLWYGLIAYAESRYEPLIKRWQYAGKDWGWAAQLKQKKRALLYLTPCKGFFYAGLVLGERLS
jgi:hypothetical protein